MGSNKNIGRRMNDFFSGWERIRVVLLGSKGTGKTVFLTSIGDQLRHYDADSLDLNGWSAAFDSDENDRVHERVLKSRVPFFPHAESRAHLTNGEWPTKTKDWSVLTVPFTLTNGGKRRRILLEMLDLPGERVADFAMIDLSYQKWCNWMETRFGGISGYSEPFKRYMGSLSDYGDDEAGKEAAIRAYKDFLSDEYGNYSLSLTPSIVKLGRDAKQRTGSKDQFRKDLEEVPVGISHELQFIPLPKECFADGAPHSQWVKPFDKAYEAYKKAVITPIASWCRHANSLLYFVDVLDLLSRGPDVYNSEKKFAEQALGFFRHSQATNIFMKPLIGMKDLFVTHVDGIYVVATKTDRVCGQEQGNRMISLAQKMLKPVVATLGLEDGKTGYLSCAAVDTSDEYEKEKAIGARIRTGKDVQTGQAIIELRQFKVDDVPEQWPDSDKWHSGSLNWPSTFPRFDKREDCPPKQKGLDAILRRILNIK